MYFSWRTGSFLNSLLSKWGLLNDLARPTTSLPKWNTGSRNTNTPVAKKSWKAYILTSDTKVPGQIILSLINLYGRPLPKKSSHIHDQNLLPCQHSTNITNSCNNHRNRFRLGFFDIRRRCPILPVLNISQSPFHKAPVVHFSFSSS